MFFGKKAKQKKENEKLLLGLHGREVKYVTMRDGVTYVESVVGRNGVINISSGDLVIMCENKETFRHSLEGLQGSELMSLGGIILSYQDGNETVEAIAYYKYHRK